MFDPVDPKQHFPSLEEGILKYWKEQDMFRRSIQLREGCDTFSFYDGPPFATGLPHYGHMVGGTIKDVIPRYQTMKGNQVQRRFGWDCHGLPVEYEIEKEFDLKSRKDIEAMGIATFNEHCRAVVQRYTGEWEKTVTRMGRWVDMKHDYRTMDSDYMESIWWVFRALFLKGLIYEGYKPMQICPRCVTPLSNFEVTQGYKDITDISAFVKFPVKGKKDTFILAWTTTPWTLPGNLFLAIHPDTDYVTVSCEGAEYIMAKALVEKVFDGKEFQIGPVVSQKELVAMSYEPLFPYFKEGFEGTAYRVVTGDFVTTEDGTGIVHIAPGFGDDDFKVGKREKVPMLQHVGMDGHFVPAVTDFAGMEVKPKDDPTKTDQKVIAWLEGKGLLFKKESYRHSYPHCWRCDSPLLNYATSSWFVKVEDFKDDLLKVNGETEWLPAHLRDGRFGKWLEGARDWAISRSRFWGTPLPIWRTQDGKHVEVLGGRDALMEKKPMRFTKVSVVRHGESEGNLRHLHQGAAPGTDLTKNGVKQAKEAAAILKQEEVSIIYCSPLARAIQTAEQIAKETGAEIIIAEELAETKFGPHEGKTFDRSDRAMTEARRIHFIGKEEVDTNERFDGMERWPEMYERLSSFLKKTLPRHRSEHIVLVTHGDPSMVVRHLFTKEDPAKLCYQPNPPYATPVAYFWDHNREGEIDLHKHVIDDVEWPATEEDPIVHLTLVRHGETDNNKKKLLQGGNIDAELNDTGRSQASEQAKALKGRTFDAIIASPLKRSMETARIIAKELGVTEVIEMEELKERDAGSWSGNTIDSLWEKFPEEPKGLCPSFHYATPEGGESLSSFNSRLEKACAILREHYKGKKVLVVSHRGTMLGLKGIAENLAFKAVAAVPVNNGDSMEISLKPVLKRIPDVLDCWFESGSMPYAQQHFPYDAQHLKLAPRGSKKQLEPTNFPADFIAEGIDQTRGWFYTLTVLSAALFKQPAFKNVVVNGTILAEDGRKMSKRLKNYPELNIVIDKYGADALRFTLMNSPAVRAEDMRFSEKVVEETLRSVLLPLWNSYSFFVTYANMANFEPVAAPHASNHPLDRWIKAETQDLVNRVTKKMDAYDLAGTCAEIVDTLDALTNWYIRLSRRRFAGKSGMEDTEAGGSTEEQREALATLYGVLIDVCKLLAPFCPYITENIYLNLVPEKNGSIHLTDWPATAELSKADRVSIEKNRALRLIVSLGNKIRSEQKIKVRQPLAVATVTLPGTMDAKKIGLGEDDIALLREEMNVESIEFSNDSGGVQKIAKVDARKVGPRLGGRVQQVIQKGKTGDFTEEPDGTIVIDGERLSPDEVSIAYQAEEGQGVAADHGVVVRVDTAITEDLQKKGLVRDVIRQIQKIRKEAGYKMGDEVTIGIGDDLKALIEGFEDAITQQTSVRFGPPTGTKQSILIGEDVMMDVYLP